MTERPWQAMVHIVREEAPDGTGGVTVTWKAAETLHGGFAAHTRSIRKEQERAALHRAGMLYHEGRLCPGDRVHMEDGSVYAVTGKDEENPFCPHGLRRCPAEEVFA